MKNFREIFGLMMLDRILVGIIDCVFMVLFLMMSILSVLVVGLR
jgi:hypothetical protein